MLAALRIAHVACALVGLVLLVASGISQVQVLLGTAGFIQHQQNSFAMVGGVFVVMSFVALALTRRMGSSGS